MGHSPHAKVEHRILIVDNDPLIRRGLVELINDMPQVRLLEEAATFIGALAALAREPADLVITELSLELPEDGLELIRYLRSTDANLLIVVLSAYPSSDYAQRALQAGANAYLDKTLATETIALALQHILNDGPSAWAGAWPDQQKLH